MIIKDYFYKDIDGVHYPDARKDTKYTYGVNFNKFLESEDGLLNSVEWSFEEGLIGQDIGIAPYYANVALALIEGRYAGTFTVTCTMHYTVEGLGQHIKVPLRIKVI